MKRDKLTKAELVMHIQDHLRDLIKLERKDIKLILDQFFREIKEALTNDKVVELRGFGTYEVRTRRGKERARNPKTGEITSVESHGVPVFRFGKKVKENVWSLVHEDEIK